MMIRLVGRRRGISLNGLSCLSLVLLLALLASTSCLVDALLQQSQSSFSTIAMRNRPSLILQHMVEFNQDKGNNDNDCNDKTLSPFEISRRSMFGRGTATVTAVTAAGILLNNNNNNNAWAAQDSGLILNRAASGLQWADARVGTGEPLQYGMPASIDYSMASTAGRFPQIYTTKDKGTPYRWTLGDGSTIQGIEMAIVGNDDMPAMRPGGIRRVIVPASLGFQALAEPNAKCIAGEAIGPIPPKNIDSAAFQRFYQLYCNPRIPYQPDLVLDIKLYGKR